MPTLWSRCTRPEQGVAIRGIISDLQEDGDHVDLYETIGRHPVSRRELRRLFEEKSPFMILWAGGALDGATLQVAEAKKCPIIVVDADDATVASLSTPWYVPHARLNLGAIRRVFAQDNATAAALAHIGRTAPMVVGRLEEGPTILPFVETDRQEIAKALQTRPVWLARGVAAEDASMLAAAQRHAARRAHRLLLVVSPAAGTSATQMAEHFAREGLTVHCRAEQSEPEEATQVFIADLEGEDGLWLRIAPIVFAGGSFGVGALHDPFSAAALGAVTVHGSSFGAYGDKFHRLLRTGASLSVSSPDKLGRAVEALLSADRVARMATAGWDVTSSGAALSNQIVSLIQDRLDSVVSA